MRKISVFLDSGAFSSFTKKVDINIEQYIDFIKSNADLLDHYSVLDVIGDAKATLKNQSIMEKNGLKPIPCYHYGDDPNYLKTYIANYDYISIGGMVPISTKDLIPWLTSIFSDFICDESGIPKVKVHGFGLTTLELMFEFPWFSVDSASWAFTGAFGSILIPLKINGIPFHNLPPSRIKISDRASQDTAEAIHFKTLSPAEQKYVLDYIISKGFKLGISSYKEVDKKYKLQENERWVIKNKEVEVREELGVSNDHNMRDKCNIQYFVELEQHFRPWPWAFKSNKLEGFGL